MNAHTIAALLLEQEDIDPKEWVMRTMPDVPKGPHVRITFLDGDKETIYIKCYWDKMAYFRGSREQPGVIPDPTDEQKRAFSPTGNTRGGDDAMENLQSARYEGSEREGTIDHRQWYAPGDEPDEWDCRPFHFQYFNDEDVPWNQLYPQEGDIVEARRRVKIPPEPEEVDPKDWVMQKMPAMAPPPEGPHIKITFRDGDKETIFIKGCFTAKPTRKQLAIIGGAGGVVAGEWAVHFMHLDRYDEGWKTGVLGDDPWDTERDGPSYREFHYEYVNDPSDGGGDEQD